MPFDIDKIFLRNVLMVGIMTWAKYSTVVV